MGNCAIGQHENDVKSCQGNYFEVGTCTQKIDPFSKSTLKADIDMIKKCPNIELTEGWILCQRMDFLTLTEKICD